MKTMKKIGILASGNSAYAVVLVVMAAGCNRTGLHTAAADGGSSSSPETQEAVVRDQAMEPQVDLWTGGKDLPSEPEHSSGEPTPEPGPEPGPEIVAEPGRDTPAERGPESASEPTRETPLEGPPDGSVLRPESGTEPGRETPPEAPVDAPVLRPETGGETASETLSEAGAPACPGAGNVTRTLAALQAEALPAALVVNDNSVFVGVIDSAQEPPSGTIVAVSLATGQTTRFSLGQNLPNQIVAVPGALFYMQGKVVKDSNGWHVDYTDVARLDLTSGQVTIVDSAVVSSATPIGAVVGNAGGVYWSMLTDVNGASVIKRWDAAAHTTQTVLSWDHALPLLIDQDHFYWSELDSGLHTVFLSMPVPSGPILQIFQWPQVFPDAPSLAAIDDQSLYYVAGGSAPPGVVAMLKTAGDDHMVLNGAQPLLFGSQTIDDKHLYWVDQADPSSIRRAPKMVNAPTETFWTTSSDAISNLTLDGCNVYWTVSVPSRLLASAK
jgi:hypothetical protein